MKRDSGLDEQCGDRGRDERHRGAEACLGYVCEFDACGVKGRYFGERREQDGQLSALCPPPLPAKAEREPLQ
jgi:hypothetical protein